MQGADGQGLGSLVAPAPFRGKPAMLGKESSVLAQPADEINDPRDEGVLHAGCAVGNGPEGMVVLPAGRSVPNDEGAPRNAQVRPLRGPSGTTFERIRWLARLPCVGPPSSLRNAQGMAGKESSVCARLAADRYARDDSGSTRAERQSLSGIASSESKCSFGPIARRHPPSGRDSEGSPHAWWHTSCNGATSEQSEQTDTLRGDGGKLGKERKSSASASTFDSVDTADDEAN